MTLDSEVMWLWGLGWDIFLGLVALGAFIYGFLAKKATANTSSIDHHDRCIIRLEERIKAIENAMAYRSDIEGIKQEVHGLRDVVSGLKMQIGQVVDALLNPKAKR